MKSFPSTLNGSGGSMKTINSSLANKDKAFTERLQDNTNNMLNTIESNIGNSLANAASFSTSLEKSFTDILNIEDLNDNRRKALYEKYNIPVKTTVNTQGWDIVPFLNFDEPNKFTSAQIGIMNNYKYVLKYTVAEMQDIYKANDENNDVELAEIVDTAMVPSLFNPMHMIPAMGVSENIPLLSSNAVSTYKINTSLYTTDYTKDQAKNITDENIKDASQLSKNIVKYIKTAATEAGKVYGIESFDIWLKYMSGLNDATEANINANKYTGKSGNSGNITSLKTTNKSTEILANDIIGLEKLADMYLTANGYNSPTVNTPDNQAQYDTLALTIGPNMLSRDITNCSISELVRCSRKKNSILGRAKYKYADFMYCRDLGKVSNNHLITLRKFAGPVSDNIFRASGASGSNDDLDIGFDQMSDNGRLISWFGTDDNKLEDIMRYDLQMTWREMNSSIQQKNSEEDSNPSLLGGLMNSLNPAYNLMQATGRTGTNNVFSWLGSKIGFGLGKSGQYQNHQAFTNYDKNKIYEPKNTIQSVNYYEGKLIQNQEFTLNFSYVLRAYENINPKSAFLDLLGNILEVTYHRGHFWGGAHKLNGPPQNTSGWKKANAMIDNAWDKLGGVMEALLTGQFSFGDILSTVSNWISGAAEMAQQWIEGTKSEGGGSFMQGVVNKFKALNNKYHWTDAMKGQLKNALGRPAMYAWDSLLSGAPTGQWHLTVGNPKNPIAAFGNLILTKTTIKHSGPLGIDDFPTNLTVSCTLKHGRSRDLSEVSRMYTKGMHSLYSSGGLKKLSDYYKLNEDEQKLEVQIISDDEFNSVLETLRDMAYAAYSKSYEETAALELAKAQDTAKDGEEIKPQKAKELKLTINESSTDERLDWSIEEVSSSSTSTAKPSTSSEASKSANPISLYYSSGRKNTGIDGTSGIVFGDDGEAKTEEKKQTNVDNVTNSQAEARKKAEEDLADRKEMLKDNNQNVMNAVNTLITKGNSAIFGVTPNLASLSQPNVEVSAFHALAEETSIRRILANWQQIQK